MLRLWESVKAGYLRLIEPVADFLVRERAAVEQEQEFLGELMPFRRG